MPPSEIREAVLQALESVDPDQGQRTAFDLARALMGVGVRFGVHTTPKKCRLAIERYAEMHGLDFEDLESEVFLVWDSVVCPEGLDPVEAAAQTAKASTMPKGFIPHAPARPRRLCWQALGVARQLSGHGQRKFFISARKLGAALEVDHMTAARVLGILCKEGYLERIGKATATRAQRFKVLQRNRGTEELRNT